MYRLLFKYTKDGWWAALLGPAFVITEVFFDAAIPNVMSKIIDEGIVARGGDLQFIYKLGIYMVVLALLAAVCGALSGILSSLAGAKFVRNIRLAMYKKIQSYDFENIEKFPVSSVTMRLTSDMRQLRMAYVSIVRGLVRAPINLIVSFFMVYKYHSKMAMIFAVVIPLLGGGLMFIFLKAHPRFVQLMGEFDDMNDNLKENIEAIRVVKTFVREKLEQLKFKKSSSKVMESQRYAESIVILDMPFFELVMYSVMIIVSWYGGKNVIFGELSTGQFMSYIAYVKNILFSLYMICDCMMMIVIASTAVKRANEILDETSSINDDNSDANLLVKDGSIEFKNVSFKYSKEAEKDTLSNINLSIKSGEVIGILGTTGSSKTTLVQLIPRLYDVTSGEVYVSGHNVKDYKLNNLRNAVSMVLQKNVLFSGSIEENVKWGNENATHEEVVEVCKKAQAHEFIMAKKEGYNYDLGQGGINVSGGQKQRLCIARALLKKPKILILDDSTSAVDTDTDHKIQLALKQEFGDMTTIIIAQRVSSVKEADRIIIMNNGIIEAIGNHDELYANNEVYRDLYETQLKGVSA